MPTQRCIVSVQAPGSRLAQAVGDDLKGKVSLGLYALGAPLALRYPLVAIALYALVAAIWFLPDRRIERQLHH